MPGEKRKSKLPVPSGKKKLKEDAPRGKYKQYSEALRSVAEGMVVNRAAYQYGIPTTTLKDGILGELPMDQSQVKLLICHLGRKKNSSTI